MNDTGQTTMVCRKCEHRYSEPVTPPCPNCGSRALAFRVPYTPIDANPGVPVTNPDEGGDK